MPSPELAIARPPCDLEVPAARPRRLAVALVSDDEVTAEACRKMLQEEGHVVHVARHSGHALLVSMSGQRIDVLIAELCMPDGSGPALMRRMRRYNPNLVALFLARPGLPCGADNVLVRPFTRNELLAYLAAIPQAAPADCCDASPQSSEQPVLPRQAAGIGS